MSPATVEKRLGRMRFMRGAFDRIHWRFVDIDSRMFMPVTREKVEGWFEEYVRVDAGSVDRLVFDVVSCIMRAIGDFVLFRRILRELGRIFYRNGTAAILIEDAGEYGLPVGDVGVRAATGHYQNADWLQEGDEDSEEVRCRAYAQLDHT